MDEASTMDHTVATKTMKWETVGVAFGGLYGLLCVFSVMTPYLAGPLFGALGILFAIATVYVSGLLLAGASRDQTGLDAPG